MKPTELVMLRNAKGQYLAKAAYEAWEQGCDCGLAWTENPEQAAVFSVEDAPPVGEGMKLESAYED